MCLVLTFSQRFSAEFTYVNSHIRILSINTVVIATYPHRHAFCPSASESVRELIPGSLKVQYKLIN